MGLGLSALAPALGARAAGSDASGLRLLNGVLSGYGLPTFAITGLQAYNGDEDDGFSFLYPRGWVLRANSQRPGVYAADFQTADKVVVEVLKAGAEVADVVAACVSPGSSDGGDSRLELPPPQKVRCALLRVVAPAGAFWPLVNLSLSDRPHHSEPGRRAGSGFSLSPAKLPLAPATTSAASTWLLWWATLAKIALSPSVPAAGATFGARRRRRYWHASFSRSKSLRRVEGRPAAAAGTTKNHHHRCLRGDVRLTTGVE